MTTSVHPTSSFVLRTNEEEADENVHESYIIEIIPTLPKKKGYSAKHLYQYQGFWYGPMYGLEGVMRVQHHFKAQSSDILLITNPKSGTTWLKALIFTIVHRTRYDFLTHPLLTLSPHQCVPFLDCDIYRTFPFSNPDNLPSPRLLSAHIPYTSLPESVITSGCRIVYICRNPKDVLVSLWHFVNKAREDLPPLPIDESFELFCKGVSPFGPFWDHVLGYWNASLECPNRILFLKYEDLKRQPLVYVTRLAEFLGHPFSPDEETQGVVNQVLQHCSFENLSNLDVNKTGTLNLGIKKNAFFRQGKVGDWVNHLTAEMIERLDQITEQKFNGSGLTFEVSS